MVSTGPGLVKRLVWTGLLLAFGWVLCAPAGASAEENKEALEAVFFYTPGCRDSAPTKDEVRQAGKVFGGRVDVRWCDLADPGDGLAHVRELFARLDACGVDATETPTLAIFLFMAVWLCPELVWPPGAR